MGNDTDKPSFSEQRRDVRRQAEQMAPATKADFTDTASHVSDAVDDTRIYKVAAGDTLRTIAVRFYGDAEGWQRIHDENRDLVDDPDHPAPGVMLKIPARS